MSTIPQSPPRSPPARRLHNGDRMTQEEFHRLYEQTPPNFKAELIGGIVYVASPLGLHHAISDPFLTTVLCTYMGHTPGVQVGTNGTVLLGRDSEPQPDGFLRILPEYGGQSRTTEDGDYVEGPPELVAEVAHSSRAIDLGEKRNDYRRYGVLEYLVLSLDDQELYWFDLPNNRQLQPDPDGILRIKIFPGLWIDRDGLLARDYRRLMDALDRGLATPEHAAFVANLAEARPRHGS